MDFSGSTESLETRSGRIAALLTSDVAREAAGLFDDARETGHDVPTASAQVIDRFRGLLSDPDEGPVIVLALAALQLREGHVQPVIYEAAIDLIDSGEALRAFAVTAEIRHVRKQLLETFADDLREFGPTG